MTTYLEIPLTANENQRLQVTLNGATYTMVARWNGVSKCWILDIYDAAGTAPILRGVPLITGADLLAQYAYLELGGMLIALTIAVGHPPEEVPTFENMGIDGYLYYVTP